MNSLDRSAAKCYRAAECDGFRGMTDRSAAPGTLTVGSTPVILSAHSPSAARLSSRLHGLCMSVNTPPEEKFSLNLAILLEVLTEKGAIDTGREARTDPSVHNVLLPVCM